MSRDLEKWHEYIKSVAKSFSFDTEDSK